MKLTVEFPASDRVYTVMDAEAMSPDGETLFITGGDFFIEISPLRDLAFELIRLGSNVDFQTEDTAVD